MYRWISYQELEIISYVSHKNYVKLSQMNSFVGWIGFFETRFIKKWAELALVLSLSLSPFFPSFFPFVRSIFISFPLSACVSNEFAISGRVYVAEPRAPQIKAFEKSHKKSFVYYLVANYTFDRTNHNWIKIAYSLVCCLNKNCA